MIYPPVEIMRRAVLEEYPNARLQYRDNPGRYRDRLLKGEGEGEGRRKWLNATWQVTERDCWKYAWTRLMNQAEKELS